MSTRKSELVHRVERALEGGVEALERFPSTESGEVDLGFDGGALPDAHFIFVKHALGLSEHLEASADDGGETVSTRLVRRLLDRQLAAGGWSIAPGLEGHLSTTVEAYVALRAGGLGAHERPVARARQYIMASGGLAAVRGPTQITLALLGLFPWSETLIPPPEIALLPPEAPVSLFRVGALLRLHLLPLVVLRASETVISSELGRSLSRELGGTFSHTPTQRPGPLRGESLEACLSLIVERLDDDGTLGGLLLATGWTAIAARALRLPDSHPLVAEPVKGLRSLVFEPEGRSVHVQVCRPTIRATALTLQGLRAGGGKQRPRENALNYIMSHAAGDRGDFELLGPRGPALAWAIKPSSRRFPNLLDTLLVVAAMKDLESADHDVRRALAWISGMQRPDGGFPLFDRDATTAPWFKRLPFGLLTHTLNDESSPEVTGKVLEAAGQVPFLKARQVDAAVGFITRSQRVDGVWQGSFSLGFIPATSAAMAGLAACGPRAAGPLKKAVDFILGKQRPEGGWGESSESVSVGEYTDLGRCSASQTATALTGLVAAHVLAPRESVEQAVEHLLWTQEPDGSWIDDDPSTASLTDVLHLRSPVDAIARPLIALRSYLQMYS